MIYYLFISILVLGILGEQGTEIYIPTNPPSAGNQHIITTTNKYVTVISQQSQSDDKHNTDNVTTSTETSSLNFPWMAVSVGIGLVVLLIIIGMLIIFFYIKRSKKTNSYSPKSVAVENGDTPNDVPSEGKSQAELVNRTDEPSEPDDYERKTSKQPADTSNVSVAETGLSVSIPEKINQPPIYDEPAEEEQALEHHVFDNKTSGRRAAKRTSKRVSRKGSNTPLRKVKKNKGSGSKKRASSTEKRVSNAKRKTKKKPKSRPKPKSSKRSTPKKTKAASKRK